MQLEQLVKLAPLAEIMSPTNQKHILVLARLAVQSPVIAEESMKNWIQSGTGERYIYLLKVVNVNQRLSCIQKSDLHMKVVFLRGAYSIHPSIYVI